jgi:hypothetical protein
MFYSNLQDLDIEEKNHFIKIGDNIFPLDFPFNWFKTEKLLEKIKLLINEWYTEYITQIESHDRINLYSKVLSILDVIDIKKIFSKSLDDSLQNLIETTDNEFWRVRWENLLSLIWSKFPTEFLLVLIGKYYFYHRYILETISDKDLKANTIKIRDYDLISPLKPFDWRWIHFLYLQAVPAPKRLGVEFLLNPLRQKIIS